MDFPKCTCQAGTVKKPRITDKSKPRLEDLPNEILTDIFKQLNARDLFRAFHNLNGRLNQLMQSFDYLQLRLHLTPSNVLKSNEVVLSYYVHTLIVDRWIEFNLQHFPNVRRLKLTDPLPNVIKQLRPNVMPRLEYLCVNSSFSMYENQQLRNEIFSNRFPMLTSCELHSPEALMVIADGKPSPVIRILRTDPLNLPVFDTVLRLCPNLAYLRFSLCPLIDGSTDSLVHDNLTQMTIDLNHADWLDEDAVLNLFLSRVPQLRKLIIHRRKCPHDILEFEQAYDWLATTISLCLPALRVFKCHVYLNSSDERAIERIRHDFTKAHTGPYQAELSSHRESI